MSSRGTTCSKTNGRQNCKSGRNPTITFRAEVGFLNETDPRYYNRKAVYVCFLAERSDGYLIDFKRIRFEIAKLRGIGELISCKCRVR